MKEIEIEGQAFKVRSIRLKERRDHNLDQYGYGRFVYLPPRMESAGDQLNLAADGARIDQAKAEAGMDKVLEIVMGPEIVNRIDELGGQRALDRVWFEIVRQTYGSRDEEKNSSRSGSGTADPTAAKATAGPAAA